MKPLLFAALLLPATATAATVITETFTSATSAVIPDGDLSGLLQSITPSTTIGTLNKITVTLTTTGGWNGDLYAYLWHGGEISVLVNRIGRTTGALAGSSGSGLSVSFDDAETTDIHAAAFSFNNSLIGPFQPDGRAVHPNDVLDTDLRTNLLSVFSGDAAAGEYRLFIADVANGDEATLTGWSVSLSGEVAAVPEPATSCGGLVLLGTLLFTRRRSGVSSEVA